MEWWKRATRIRRSDYPFLALVIAICAVIGVHFLFTVPASNDGRDGLAPTYFGSSVLYALGRGFHTPMSPTPTLEAFFKHQTTTVTANDLPPTVPVVNLDPFVQRHFHLFLAVGLLWRLFGVSWSVVTVLLLFLFCVTSAAVYGIFRLAMNRALSAAGAILFTLSPLVLDVLPYLRDFGKAPFLLLTILILGRMLKRRSTLFALLRDSALLGLALGIGLGFRQDVLLGLLPSVLVLAFGVRASFKARIWPRPAAILLMLAVFTFAAFPVLRSMVQSAPTSFHHIATGFSPACEGYLLTQKTSYLRSYTPDDPVVHAQYASYAHRVNGVDHPIGWWTREAGAAAQGFVLKNAGTFPADMLLRGYAATLWVLESTAAQVGMLKQSTNAVLRRVADALTPVAIHLAHCAPYWTAAALLIMAAANMRLAAWTLLLLLYFCGTTSLQFQMRHAFHLTFAGFWFLGFLLDRAIILVRGLARSETRNAMLHPPREVWAPAVKRMVIFAGTAALIILASMYAARVIQWRTVGRLLERCQAANLEPIETTPESPDNAWTLFRIKDRPPLPESQIDLHTQYFVVELISSVTSRVLVQPQYDHEALDNNFSNPIVVWSPTLGNPVTMRCFLPAYEYPDGSAYGRNRFAGIAFPTSRSGDFRRLYRVKNIDTFDLLPVMAVPEDAAAFRRCQSMAPLWPQLNARYFAKPESM